jgi:hypothetical protein
MTPDDNFEIHSIELVYGNDQRMVHERIALDIENSKSPEDAVLHVSVEESGDRGELSDTISIPVSGWLNRFSQLLALHAKNQLTMDPEMYNAIRSINEDADSPFKGMISMPDEDNIIFKRDESL